MSQAAPPRHPRRRGRWAVRIAALLVAALTAAYVYFRILRPPPRAHLHLPPACAAALRVDGVDLLAFEPVRNHVLPVLRDARLHQRAGGPSLRERLKAATGIGLPDDVREVAFGSADGVQWVAAIGGNLESGRFVRGLETILREDGVAGWTRDGDLLLGPLGWAIAQADDGTIVLGTTASVVRSSLPARDPSATDLRLPHDAAIGFVAMGDLLDPAFAVLPGSKDLLEPKATFDLVTGTFSLGSEPALDLTLRPRSRPAAELAPALQTQLAALGLMLMLVPANLHGARQAIAGAVVKAEGQDVRVHAPWPRAELESAAAELAPILAAFLAEPALVQ